MLQSDIFEELGLTNMYIDQVLKKACSNYKGVFSSNNLPKRVFDTGCLVCNLSESSQIGSHFITIIIDKDKVSYLDSFGIRCENDEIRYFLRMQNKPIMFNNTMIQSLQSNFCGFFCIMFCIYYGNKFIFPLVFSNNLNKNDEICMSYISKMVNKA